MADPLSVTASIIAVLGAIEGVTKTLAKIKNIRNAPQELLALINEVNDLKLILSDVQNYVSQTTGRPQVLQEPLQHMSILVNRARSRLLELDELVQYRFTKAGSTVDQIKVSRREWARARSTIDTFRQNEFKAKNSCKFLLQAGADPHLEAFGGGRSAFENAWNVIFTALEGGAIIETLQSLFPDNGGHLDERRFSKLHRLILDLEGGSLENELKNSSSDIDASDSRGYTVLIWAARRGDNAAVGLLLRAGADPNIHSNFGTSALLEASRTADPTCVKLLLEAGADPSLVDNYGGNALHFATRFQDKKWVIEALVAAGVNLHKQDIYGSTSLTIAAYSNRTVTAGTLLNLGANMNSTDHEGCTPLHESLFHNSDNVTQLLVRRGAALTTENYGNSPLHLTALSGGMRTLKILRAATNLGTLDPDARNKEGKTPLQIARERVAKPEGFIAKFHELLKEVRKQKVALETSFEAASTGPDATFEDIFVDAPEDIQPVGDAAGPPTPRGQTRSSLWSLTLSYIGPINLLTSLIWTRRLWNNIQPNLAQSVCARIFLSWLFGLVCAGLAYWVFGQVRGEDRVRKGASVIYLGGGN
ncbi:MAG: hypothetical protein Q9187_005073 [Circinaria calcarea]